MKVAIVHDYIKEYGGAERVLEALHEMWPEAPVFTSLYIPNDLGPHKERFSSPTGEWDIRTSWLAKIPFKEKFISIFRVISPLVFNSFDFSGFDVVIVSATGAYIPNAISNIKYQISNIQIKNKKPDKRPIHICYCHTPPRYLYGYATAREWKNKIVFRILGEVANHFLRLVDFKAAQNVDYFIANSKETASRIKKFYKREAKVIYPPVDINSEFNPSASLRARIQSSEITQSSKYQILNTKYYYLAGGRLARAKHVDLIVRACRELDVPLKVFGKGFGGIQNSTLRLRSGREFKVQNSKIEFVGEVTDEEKFELMRNAKAYIFASEDEDFGITPVEAMAVGTPVIAYRSGGVVESVLNNKTGLFFDQLTVESLKDAILKFNKIEISSKECIKQTEKFSKERFKREIENFINSNLKAKNSKP